MISEMKTFSLVLFFHFIVLTAFTQNKNTLFLAKGQMPFMTRDRSGTMHIVYGRGDSILYISSRDGKTFTPSSLVAVLPGLMASAMRGPQIAASDIGIVVTACTRQGNIFSYEKEINGKWTKALRINNINEQAKEALMALSADGMNVYSVWLGVNGPKGQSIIGSSSVDGGRTWGKNTLVYSSPGGSVCDCCKPSTVVKGNKVYVLFRNLVEGNRDLYLIQSSNGGKSFGQVIKLGNGSWKLNACPMDGGGLAIDQQGNPETVWRREGKIYADSPGKPEKEIGEGRGCSIETINNKVVYAWSENGDVILLKPDGRTINLGKGSLPIVKAMNDKELICIWEHEKQILGSVVEL
jgi:hypothetical protein